MTYVKKLTIYNFSSTPMYKFYYTFTANPNFQKQQFFFFIIIIIKYNDLSSDVPVVGFVLLICKSARCFCGDCEGRTQPKLI